jgi:opacity protein-like surface antigen
MNLTGKIAIAAAAVVAFSGSAMAADLYVPPAAPVAPVVTTTNWDGPYIGATVGYSWYNSGVLGAANGWDIGAQLGYNFHVSDAIVLGLQGDVNWISTSYPTNPSGWNGAIVARLGYDAGAILPYVEAGVAFADINFPAPTGSQSSAGWTAGAGIEFMLADQWSVNVEYRYADYGSFGGGVGDINDNSIRVGLNYHF